jgi:hypothetical protein
MTKEFFEECSSKKLITFFSYSFFRIKSSSILLIEIHSWTKTLNLTREWMKNKKKKITTTSFFRSHRTKSIKKCFPQHIHIHTRGISSHHEQNLLNIKHFPTYHLLSATTTKRSKKERVSASDTINICVEYTIIFFFPSYNVLPHECVARTKIVLHVWESFITLRKFKPP